MKLESLYYKLAEALQFGRRSPAYHRTAGSGCSRPVAPSVLDGSVRCTSSGTSAQPCSPAWNKPSVRASASGPFLSDRSSPLSLARAAVAWSFLARYSRKSACTKHKNRYSVNGRLGEYSKEILYLWYADLFLRYFKNSFLRAVGGVYFLLLRCDFYHIINLSVRSRLAFLRKSL